MNAKTLIAIILLALAGGCGLVTPARGSGRPGPTPQPPWITNSGKPAPVEITVADGESRTLDGPVSIGRLVLEAGSRVEATSLEVVTGWIYVHHDAVLIAPHLTSCGVLRVGEGSKVEAPQLWKANQVIVQDDATIVAPLLRKCTTVIVRDGVTFDAPCAAQAERQ